MSASAKLRVPRAYRSIGVFLVLLIGVTSSAYAEYKLCPGDVVNVNIFGAVDLSTKAAVDIDGQITLPIVGQIALAGLSLIDARARIQGKLAGKEYRRRGEDGREYPVLVSPSEINVSIAEYRPIYVTGDVAKPGEQIYRPRLTVRKAIALAGGYDSFHSRISDPVVQLVDLTGQNRSLLITLAKEKATLERLQAELDDRKTLNSDVLAEIPIPETMSRAIISDNSVELEAELTNDNKELLYLNDAAKKEGDRVGVLAEQQSKEQEGVKEDLIDLQRYEELFKKGAVALPGLSDARRTVLLSSTRALQTTALLASVQREESDLDRRIERVREERRIERLRQSQDTRVQIALTKAELQAVAERARYVGMLQSQLAQGAEGRPTLDIVRSDNGATTHLSVELDTELQPGDVAEITLQVSSALKRW